MVINGVAPYVRRLEDIIAVAFSASTDIWHMVFLTVQDKESMAVHIRWLREKPEKNPAEPEFIKTVNKVGYMLDVKAG